MSVVQEVACPMQAHPVDPLLRSDRLPHILCPGCGIGIVMHCYSHAMVESGIELRNHVCVSGIGCSGRAAGYVNIDSYHTTHGRAIPFALGVAVYNPALRVTVISGDGDLSSIGGNHLIHAARRNVDLNIVCINNFNYGMTGGQAGPTTPLGARTSTTPFGCWERPFNLPHLAKAVGASFVARWTVLHVRQLKDAILHGIRKRGFTFIEVLSPCPTGFGRPNNVGDGLQEMERYRQLCKVDHEAELGDIDIDLRDKNRPIIVGNFVDVEREPFAPIVSGPVKPPRSDAGWAGVRRTTIPEEQNGVHT
ncbi:MAG: 2-oxoacid:ferredoxin oxidoreductase subunit beta [Candidatus Hydrogenedentes bacterium]|nr:2-oxoacid:ferredoxin oxidoreductase subunit beta [Candidatus Hydrogenedentota bacterium]